MPPTQPIPPVGGIAPETVAEFVERNYELSEPAPYDEKSDPFLGITTLEQFETQTAAYMAQNSNWLTVLLARTGVWTFYRLFIADEELRISVPPEGEGDTRRVPLPQIPSQAPQRETGRLI